jgi:hypothetical protein
MKKLFALLAVAALVVACNNSTDTNTNVSEPANAVENIANLADSTVNALKDSAGATINQAVDSLKAKAADVKAGVDSMIKK